MAKTGVRGCPRRAKPANPSPAAARSPLPQSGRGLLSADISRSDQVRPTTISQDEYYSSHYLRRERWAGSAAPCKAPRRPGALARAVWSGILWRLG